MPQPIYGGTVTLSATTTSSNVSLGAAGAAATMIGILHAGPGLVFVKIGKGAQTASTADCAIVASQAGATFLPKKAGDDNIAAVSQNAGPVQIFFTPYESSVVY